MELLLPSAGLIIVSLFVLVTWGLWLIALIDILRSQFTGGNDKVVWVLIVLFAPFVGAVLYFIIGKRNKINYN